MRIGVAVWVALLLATASRAEAQDRSGVRPEVLSLPDGPGSIEGLGESFEPSPATGTSAYSVSVRVPPGVAGFQPSLALRYSSGGGNGALGLGWSLGLPMVQRATDDGLPHYDASDRIVLRGMDGRGAEDLVQLADGSWRFRVEGAFVRGRQRDDGTWEFRNRSGVRFRFGTSDTSTVREGSRVFAWCLTEQEDLYGHLITYEHERDAAGHPYLARVVYNDFSPEVRNEVLLQYEDRPDPTVSFLPTFPDRVARRLTAIEVRHGGQLVRRYELAYGMMTGLSRLTSVRMVGRDGETSLPTLTLDYVPFEPERAEVVTMSAGPARALGDVAEIDDVDGDALPDLLVTDPGLDSGRYSWVPNLDGAAWGEREILAESPSVWLSARGVQLADMDGDGAADVVARVSGASDGTRFYPATSDGFGTAVVLRPAPSFPLEDPDVRLVDLNHDRRTDWLRIDPTTGEVTVAFHDGAGTFSAAASVGRLDPSEVLSFSRSGLRLADMNGDGMSDLVAVRDSSVRYWPSSGFGAFGDVVALPGAPTLSDAELTEVQIRDLNGDGTADVVHVGVRTVRYWLNFAGNMLVAAMAIDGVPERRSTTVVRVADMNGNGTADIVWIDPPAGAEAWRYLDVLPRGTPGLLRSIDNGLGRMTSIEYAGMGEMRRWARDNAVAWTRRSPIGQTVVHRISSSSGLDPAVVYEMRYADGYFDGARREFRGFARSIRIDVGDDEQPGSVTDRAFDVGETDEALKGMITRETRATLDGSVFDEEISTNVVQTVDMSAAGEPVRYAYRAGSERTVLELTSSPLVLRAEWEHDDFGNVIREASYGLVSGDDVSFGDDERVVVRAYATDVSRWILDRVVSERTEDLSGRRLAETRTYYDGEPFIGRPLGELGGAAAVSRTESWIEEERFADDMRFERDEHGNPSAQLDARGGRRELDWDPASHTFPVEERVYPEEGRALTFTAEHDRAFGVILHMTDPSGHETRARYDALARVEALIEPGDSEELPTRSWEYHLAAPLSYVREEQREVSGELGTIVRISHTDGLGRQRGVFLEAGDLGWAASGLVAYGPRGWPRVVARPTFERSADVVAADDGRSATTTRYDALGRNVSELEPDGSERRREYAPLATMAWDENDTDATSTHFDTPTRREEDGLGRIVRVVERDGMRDVVTTFSYDGIDNLTWMRDAEGRERSYSYDGRSRRRSVDDPNAGIWRFEHSDGNDLVRRLDPAGHSVRWEHDDLGRTLIEWHQRAGEPAERAFATYHWDEPSADHPELQNLEGRLAWVEDDAGSVFFGYDPRGRTTDRIRRFGDGVEYPTWMDWDAVDRPARRGFPDGTHLPFRYDERGMLSGLGGIVEHVSWTAWGGLDEVRFGNGVTVERGYDQRQRVETFGARSDRGGLLLDLRYVLDRASRVRAMDDRRMEIADDLSLSFDFEFDDRYRLVGARDRVGSTTWGYDDVGNVQMVSSTHAAPFLDATATYGEGGAGPDQLTHFGAEEFTYDAAGRVETDGSRTYEYDAKGRLARVTRGETVEEYVYGYDDERVLKRVTVAGRMVETRYIDADVEERGGELVRYVMLGDQRIARLDAVDRETVSFGSSVVPVRTVAWWLVLGAGLTLLMVVHRPSRRRAGWAVAFLLFSCGDGGDPRGESVPIDAWPQDALLYVNDIQGSPVLLADASGIAVERTARHPYGVVRASDGTVAEPYGFVGNEVDPGAELSDFNARPYRADLGRFLAVEPMLIASLPEAAQPSRWQAYSYGMSDPVNGVDANGRFVLGIGLSGELAAVVGGSISAGVYVEIRIFDEHPGFEVGVYDEESVSAGFQFGDDAGVEVTASWGARASEVWGDPAPEMGAHAGLAFGGGIEVSPDADHPLERSSVTASVTLGTDISVAEGVSVGHTYPVLTGGDTRGRSETTTAPDPTHGRRSSTRAERSMDAGARTSASATGSSASRRAPNAPMSVDTGARESGGSGCGVDRSC